MHPKHHGNKNQSSAEAIIDAGQSMVFLSEEKFEVSVGDTLCIKPGTPHHIKNTGTTTLHILCMCSPPYSHEDTELL